MYLASVKNIKNLLNQRGLRPSRKLGQNFLIDKEVIREIIEAAALQSDDTVLEIGPGPGVLTQELAKRVQKVIAVEKDRNMVEILKDTLKSFPNVEIIKEDIRYLGCPTSPQILGDVGHPDIGRKSDFQKFKIVGNLPFYLTAPVIRQFLENTEVKPMDMTLVVQKEVAQRICSKPPDMNLLAVSVQFYAKPEIISYISKKSFWPSPEVDAAILKITPFTKSVRTSRYSTCAQRISEIDKSLFFKIVKAGFSQPRKQLINNLSKGLKIDKKKVGEWLLQKNMQPTQRAETLNMNDWLNLAENFKIN